jgi:hypothetical protein
MDPQVVLDKLMRLARLDFTVFDEVKADAQHTIPAAVIAVVSFLVFGLGGFLYVVLKDSPGWSKGEVFVKSVILGDLFAIGLWAVWLFVAFAVLTSVFRASGDIQMLLRTMGYAAIALVPGFLFFIPKIGFAFGIGALVALVAVTNWAIQSTTNASPQKTFIANMAGFMAFAVILSLLASTGRDNPFAPNVFLTWWAVEA